MAAVAQQYYEDAAQNEQMGEDEGVSTISLSFWRSRMIKIPLYDRFIQTPGRCLRCHPE